MRASRTRRTDTASPASEPFAVTATWRRLDVPGHDVCIVRRNAHGFRLDGCAVFREHGRDCRLHYHVAGDAAWVTERARVTGWLGERPVDLRVARGAGGSWTFGGAPVRGLRRCRDVDFGFTPATNLLQLRRADLAIGAHAEFVVAWLDADTGPPVALPQRYERRRADAYWYESPTVGYAALLRLAPNGFVRRYPRLWTLEE